MSNADFEAWFLEKHNLTAAKANNAFNATQSNVLRASVATYSVHLKLATALNLPLAQWLWLVNGALLGLAVVLVLLLAYLLQLMVGLQKAQVTLLRKLEEVYGGGEGGRDVKDSGQRKSKSKSKKSPKRKKSGQKSKSGSPKITKQTSPKGGTPATTRRKKSRSKSSSPKTTSTSLTTSTAKKKTN